LAASIIDMIELIRGELREGRPSSPPHAEINTWLSHWSFEFNRRGEFWVRVKNPVALVSVDSEPEPDLVWAKRQNYARRHPSAEDGVLLVEIADWSLEFDRGEKASLYAEAGIHDYWLVNLIDETIEVRREPKTDRYLSQKTLGNGEVVSTLAMPEAALNVGSLFGSRK
jgi:Uma2 family endonuclease